LNVAEFQLPTDWKISSVADAFDFTSKPRGLDLSKNGDEIPFFPMDQIPLGRIHVSQFTPKPLSRLGSGTYVENGDLMVAKITPSFENGKQAIVDIDTDFAYATTEVIPLRGRKGKSDTLFLIYCRRIMTKRLCLLSVTLLIISGQSNAGGFGLCSINAFMDWEPTGCTKPFPPSYYVYDADSYNAAVNEYNNYLHQVRGYVSCIETEAENDAKIVAQAIANELDEANQIAISDLQNARANLEAAKLLLN